MPPARQTQAKPAAKTAPAHPDSADNALHPVQGNPSACPPPLCPEDFPLGWPGPGTSVGCTHGMWIREWPPSEQAREQHDEPKTPGAQSATKDH